MNLHDLSEISLNAALRCANYSQATSHEKGLCAAAVQTEINLISESMNNGMSDEDKQRARKTLVQLSTVGRRYSYREKTASEVS